MCCVCVCLCVDERKCVQTSVCLYCIGEHVSGACIRTYACVGLCMWRVCMRILCQASCSRDFTACVMLAIDASAQRQPGMPL